MIPFWANPPIQSTAKGKGKGKGTGTGIMALNPFARAQNGLVASTPTNQSGSGGQPPRDIGDQFDRFIGIVNRGLDTAAKVKQVFKRGGHTSPQIKSSPVLPPSAQVKSQASLLPAGFLPIALLGLLAFLMFSKKG